MLTFFYPEAPFILKLGLMIQQAERRKKMLTFFYPPGAVYDRRYSLRCYSINTIRPLWM